MMCVAALPQRVIAKHGRDFDTADALRQQLREGGVLVDDGARTYRVVGPSVNRSAAALPTEHGYTRVGDFSLVVAPQNQAVLDQLLLQRVCAKRTRDFSLADSLDEQLRQGGVRCNDRCVAERRRGGGAAGGRGQGAGGGGRCAEVLLVSCVACSERTYYLVPPRQPRTLPSHHTYQRVDNGAVSGAFPSCVRSISTEIYLCHACSCQEILSGNAPAGGAGTARSGAARPAAAPAHVRETGGCRSKHAPRSRHSWAQPCPAPPRPRVRPLRASSCMCGGRR
eukprot:SAG25_NODE_244_length_11127_cov_82.802956_13_plen_281_part_00